MTCQMNLHGIRSCLCLDRAHDAQLSDKLLTILTILLSLLVFVVAPLEANGAIGGRYFGLVFGMVLIPAAFMLAANRVAAGSIVAAIILLVIASETELRESTLADTCLDTLAWLIAGVTLIAVVSRAVFGPGKVTIHRIIGGVLLYLVLGLTFVALFGLLTTFVSDAFKGLEPRQGGFAIVGDLIYFSFVTLTTIGYGDITPLHPYARGLANFEAVIGQLYPATLLARLVTLELATEQADASRQPPSA
ncbi:MAG: potassium channel family protein [Xanthobacteraceae bacterium]